MRTITRPLEAHAYSAGTPRQGIQAPSHVIVHHNTAHGTTPVTSGVSAMYAADGAPYFNSGYQYPQHGPLVTGGFPSLRLPPQAAMIDLTDMSTWDRPVWIPGR